MHIFSLPKFPFTANAYDGRCDLCVSSKLMSILTFIMRNPNLKIQSIYFRSMKLWQPSIITIGARLAVIKRMQNGCAAALGASKS